MIVGNYRRQRRPSLVRHQAFRTGALFDASVRRSDRAGNAQERIVRSGWASERRPVSVLFLSLAWMGFSRLRSSCQVRPCHGLWAHSIAVSSDRCQAAAPEAVCRPVCRTHLRQGPNPCRHVYRQKTRPDQSRACRPLGQGRWA